MLMSIDYFQYGKVSTIPKSYLEFKLYKKEAFTMRIRGKGIFEIFNRTNCTT